MSNAWRYKPKGGINAGDVFRSFSSLLGIFISTFKSCQALGPEKCFFNKHIVISVASLIVLVAAIKVTN